jgi:superoxide dismutase, Fe-Mn family
MKKIFKIFIFISIIVFLQSCNNKKFTEVVEVPLPTAEEKLTIGNPEDVEAKEGVFSLQKLPYKYDALSPSIDVGTLEIHYSKHYLAYTEALNKALDSTQLSDLSIEEILAKAETTNMELRNNAGGYYNHNIYWESMIPKGGGTPKDTLAASIDRDFGSFESFKSKYKTAANQHFGSGWAWLITDKEGKLQITTTQNQDNTLMPKSLIKGTPILALDLWEHAYYLSYQNKRKKYIDNFFEVINWKKVQERYEEAIKK